MSDKFKPGDKVRARICAMTGTVIGPHPVHHDSLVILADEYSEGYRVIVTSYLELIPEPRKVEGWVNVYDDYSESIIYTSKKEAVRYPGQGYRASVYVSGTEGVEP